MKRLTSTNVVTGRIEAKRSPCARAASLHRDMSVRRMRVRMTVSRERPADLIALSANIDAASRLRRDVARPNGPAIVPDRRGARDREERPDPHGAGEADFRFQR